MKKRRLGSLEVSALGRYLDENIASAEIDLSEEDLCQIEDAYSKIPVRGDRLSEVQMSFY